MSLDGCSDGPMFLETMMFQRDLGERRPFSLEAEKYHALLTSASSRRA